MGQQVNLPALCRRRNVLLKGLSARVVTTEEDALALLFEGECNRAVSEHQLNKVRSASATSSSLELWNEQSHRQTLQRRMSCRPAEESIGGSSARHGMAR